MSLPPKNSSGYRDPSLRFGIKKMLIRVQLPCFPDHILDFGQEVMLQWRRKWHWIIVAHSRFNQPFGVAGHSRGHNFHAWRMDKIHFRILRMEGTSVDTASGRAAQHQRSRGIPAVMRLGHHVDDLVEGAADEVYELEFGYWPHAGKCRAKSRAND